jgi:hypothetical protein
MLAADSITTRHFSRHLESCTCVIAFAVSAAMHTKWAGIVRWFVKRFKRGDRLKQREAQTTVLDPRNAPSAAITPRQPRALQEIIDSLSPDDHLVTFG